MPAQQTDSGPRNTIIPVVLIAPSDEGRRDITKTLAATQARIVKEFADYPGAASVSGVLAGGCDIVVVDLDAGFSQGIEVIETVSRCGIPATVIACSRQRESDTVIRAMRAGAREFLAAPFTPEAFAEAFDRAWTRLRASPRERPTGKVIVFQGAKGGIGTTTLAINFAVSLMREEAGKVVLVDMHPQLGEAALGLGLAPQFSIADALGNAVRLDADFLYTLLARHESGLMVLASSDAYGVHRSLERGSEKLVRILREEFAWVIVDAGPCSANIPDALFEMTDTIYLVTDASLPALRNARRLISFFMSKERPAALELVMNRFNSRMVEIDEASALKALGRGVDWKIPNDYAAVRGAQNLGVALMNRESPLARVIRQMARSVAGLSVNAPVRKAAAATTGDKWKFWTSNSTRRLSTAHS